MQITQKGWISDLFNPFNYFLVFQSKGSQLLIRIFTLPIPSPQLLFRRQIFQRVTNRMGFDRHRPGIEFSEHLIDVGFDGFYGVCQEYVLIIQYTILNHILFFKLPSTRLPKCITQLLHFLACFIHKIKNLLEFIVLWFFGIMVNVLLNKIGTHTQKVQSSSIFTRMEIGSTTCAFVFGQGGIGGEVQRLLQFGFTMDLLS